MSTNSVIAISTSHNDFDLTAIYAHWDGGQAMADELDEHFDSWAQARALVALGDLSGISEGIAESYQGRGESWERVKPTEGKLKEVYLKYRTAEFFHIFHDGEWQFLSRTEVKEIIDMYES